MKITVRLDKDDFCGHKITKSDIKDAESYLEEYIDNCLTDSISDAFTDWKNNNLNKGDKK